MRLAQSERVRRRAGGRDGVRRLPDRWSLAKNEGGRRSVGGGERLRPGQLDGLVLKYLDTHTAERALGSGSHREGAWPLVGRGRELPSRLAAAEQVRQTGKVPRRYSALAY